MVSPDLDVETKTIAVNFSAEGGDQVLHTVSLIRFFYVKGKGMMETYFLCGKDDFSRPLPDVSLAQSLEAPDCK